MTNWREITDRIDNDFFREIEHTGDVGIEIEADSRAEMFHRAALAEARLMVDTAGVLPIQMRDISIEGSSDTDLMHDLLSGLLQIFLVDNFIWSAATVEEARKGLKVRLRGEPFDAARHEFLREIKAVTYHELSVHNAGGRWLARIIFDV